MVQPADLRQIDASENITSSANAGGKQIKAKVKVGFHAKFKGHGLWVCLLDRQTGSICRE